MLLAQLALNSLRHPDWPQARGLYGLVSEMLEFQECTDTLSLQMEFFDGVNTPEAPGIFCEEDYSQISPWTSD